MKRILLHGYTASNLGDDLFFRVIADRYPDVQFVLPTLRTDYQKLLADVKNLKIVDFFKIANVTNHKTYMLPKLYSKLTMKKYNAVVCIGGSLFIDRKNPSKNDRIEAENYSFIADWEYASRKNIPYYILGANWGPCYNSYFFDYFSNAFDHVSDLYFRDTESYETFREKKNIRHGADILLGSEYVKKLVPSFRKKKQVAFSIISPDKKGNSELTEEYFNKTIELVNEFTDRGYRVVLLSFCSQEGDADAVRYVSQKVRLPDKIDIVYYTGNCSDILTVIAASEIVVASRFHATVLSWTLGVPAFSIAYSNKTIALLKDFDVPGSGCQIKDIIKITADTVISKATIPDYAKTVQESLPFEKLDALIKE